MRLNTIDEEKAITTRSPIGMSDTAISQEKHIEAMRKPLREARSQVLRPSFNVSQKHLTTFQLLIFTIFHSSLLVFSGEHHNTEDRHLQETPDQGDLPRPELHCLDQVVLSDIDDVHQDHKHNTQCLHSDVGDRIDYMKKFLE